MSLGSFPGIAIWKYFSSKDPKNSYPSLLWDRSAPVPTCTTSCKGGCSQKQGWATICIWTASYYDTCLEIRPHSWGSRPHIQMGKCLTIKEPNGTCKLNLPVIRAPNPCSTALLSAACLHAFAESIPFACTTLFPSSQLTLNPSKRFTRDPTLTSSLSSDCDGSFSGSLYTLQHDTNLTTLQPRIFYYFHRCDFRNRWLAHVHWENKGLLFSCYRRPYLTSYMNQVSIQYCLMDKKINYHPFKPFSLNSSQHEDIYPYKLCYLNIFCFQFWNKIRPGLH